MKVRRTLDIPETPEGKWWFAHNPHTGETVTCSEPVPLLSVIMQWAAAGHRVYFDVRKA